jgi:hypothetical protein
MDLVLVGTFETVTEAEAAVERMAELKGLAEAEWSDDAWDAEGRMPERIVRALLDMNMIEMGRDDVDIFVYEHTVERSDARVRIWTEESDVSGFLKVLIHLGARVEVFSRHNWNEDGTTRSAERE